jgi:anti-sigma-K factor RskA
MTTCPHRDDAGAWVLGALGAEDARAFAVHLEDCAGCRHDVEELQTVADVLPMAAPQLAPPPALKGRIMDVVSSEAELLRAAGTGADRPPAQPPGRRRRRPWAALRPLPAAALAALLLALGVVTGVLLSGGDDARTIPGTGPRGAQVALRVQDDHGELELHAMPPPPAGRVYQVWLQRGDQAPRPTRTLFTVPGDGRATVRIAEPLDGTDRVLVTDEPPGGSRAPTRPPVAGATLT